MGGHLVSEKRVGPGRVSLLKTNLTYQRGCRTRKESATKPATRTALSSVTETAWRRVNAASKGLSEDVASIEPICVRSAAMRGLMLDCEIAVKTIINATQMAAGVAREAKLRVRKTRAARKTSPATIPPRCITVRLCPTIAPA